MISELYDPLNARGGPIELYRPAISYIFIYTGLNGLSELKESWKRVERDPIRVEYTRSELKSWKGGWVRGCRNWYKERDLKS
jgi:hypothetical protein